MTIQTKYNIGDVVKYKNDKDCFLYYGLIAAIYYRENIDGITYEYDVSLGIDNARVQEPDIICRMVEE